MKSLLWIVLVAALATNAFASLGTLQEGVRITVSVVSGVVVLGAGTGLWMLRERHDA
ncbi:hypothetical protein [Streptomyces sp. NPDC014734]|uniref:hypothetical protein n=1 Tax=Streptomyces sp. NPDC014734 TaxID=3364886 RepID=UPI0036F8E89A